MAELKGLVAALSPDGDLPRDLTTCALPPETVIGVLAPHPDDFDAIGVTMRWLHERGHSIHLAVVTSGASGVDGGYAGAVTAADKRAIREKEQRDSIRLFGLAEERLTFLHVDEDAKSHPFLTDENCSRVRAWLVARKPALVFLPHHHDTNVSHQRTHALLKAVASFSPLIAMLNRDPKTIAMRADLYVPFGDDRAEWKGALMRCHRSQQARNLARRGHGVDARVLETNRAIATELTLAEPFAECFEVEPLPGAEYPGAAPAGPS